MYKDVKWPGMGKFSIWLEYGTLEPDHEKPCMPNVRVPFIF